MKSLIMTVAFLAVTPASFAQAPSSGAREVVGLFAATCLSFANDPGAIRAFMRERHVPELNDQGREKFLRDRVGVGFNASNKVTRLALVSEDNGACTTFAGQADAAETKSLLMVALKSRGFGLTQAGRKSSANMDSAFYEMTIKNRLYTLVISSSRNPASAVQAAITLAPKI